MRLICIVFLHFVRIYTRPAARANSVMRAIRYTHIIFYLGYQMLSLYVKFRRKNIYFEDKEYSFFSVEFTIVQRVLRNNTCPSLRIEKNNILQLSEVFLFNRVYCMYMPALTFPTLCTSSYAMCIWHR